MKSSNFPIIYFKQENMGKARSINKALFLANGDFFLVFDSDDWCTDDAFQRFMDAWNELGEVQHEYCSISSLKSDAYGNVIGEDYSRMATFDESYIHRFNRRISGDKWEFIKTSIHREHLYKLAEDERYLAPEYAWLGMGADYKTVFLNEILGIIEYQHDGISRNNLSNRIGSPNSACEFYRRGILYSKVSSVRLRMRINAYRFSLHANCKSRALNLGAISLIGGLFFFLIDNLRLSAKNNKYINKLFFQKKLL